MSESSWNQLKLVGVFHRHVASFSREGDRQEFREIPNLKNFRHIALAHDVMYYLITKIYFVYLVYSIKKKKYIEKSKTLEFITVLKDEFELKSMQIRPIK